jgi:hypothetical protein
MLPLRRRGIAVPANDLEYCRLRAMTERDLAHEANQTEVRIIHDELARQYEALAAQLELKPKVLIRLQRPSSGHQPR